MEEDFEEDDSTDTDIENPKKGSTSDNSKQKPTKVPVKTTEKAS